MEVLIDRLDHQGRGIANIDKVTFIPNAIKGEVVDIDIVSSKSKYNIGKVKKYIKTSSKRIDAICPYFSLCGGCDLMHISYDDELEYKESKIRDIMNRYASISNVEKIVSCDNINGYRDKITFKVDKKLGLYEKESHNIKHVDKCLLVSDKINKYIPIINKMNLKGITEVVIRESFNDLMIIFMCDEDVRIDTTTLDTNVLKCFKGRYTIFKGNDYIIDKIGDMQYKISPSSFFQVNKYQVEKLYDLVLENLDLNKDDVLLDLYCGTGTIGIYVAKYVNKVLGIEINSDAIKDAEYNKILNKIDNISFIAGDSKIIHNIKYKPNKIVVDPPRAGLDKKVIEDILNINPDRLVYVSCDPITLGRDLNAFKEKYTIKKVIPVDMFPRTYHVECVCVLEKKDI